VKIPVFLAGGLKAENVRQAIDEVEPFGIDVCSGVRTDGMLDERKLELFIKNVLL
jgi:phosphoribosylanthranilate isomerase